MRWLAVLALLTLACSDPTVDQACVRKSFIVACEVACTKLGGAVMVDPPSTWASWADCTCADAMRTKERSQHSFMISRHDYVPGHEWPSCHREVVGSDLHFSE